MLTVGVSQGDDEIGASVGRRRRQTYPHDVAGSGKGRRNGRSAVAVDEARSGAGAIANLIARRYTNKY